MKKLMIALLILMLFSLPLMFLQKKKVRSPIEESVQATCEIFITVDNQSIPLETYLVGVLAGEMPASFHEEALKAQAITARTYAVRQTEFGKNMIQSTTSHQVFKNEQERQEKWQTTFQQYETKLQQAIAQTENLILTYDGEPITAMFHASSSEQTESAANYSGNAIPYLQSVQTAEVIESETVHFTADEL